MNAISKAFDRFFYQFEVPRAKLTLFRIVFFALVAIDAFLEIEHAPRYGAGDFNVAHFEFLDAFLPLPSRHGMLIAYLLQAYLALRIMMGVTIRGSCILLTALFGYSYFISQVNSYQHHYLLFLVLGVCCFLPWKEERETLDPMAMIPSWAMRVLLCQLSILYFWTGIAKLAPHWLSGETLASQVPSVWFRDIIHGIATTFGTEDLTIWAALSIGVAVTELVLGVLIHMRSLWSILPLFGLVFHGSIEFLGYKIGLFSYFMIAFYIMLLPDSWLTAPARFFSPKGEADVGKKKRGKGGNKDGRLRGPDGKKVGIRGGPPELGMAAGAALVAYALLRTFDRFDNVQYVLALVIFIYVVSIAIQYYPQSWVGAVSSRLEGLGKSINPWAFWAVALAVGTLPLLVMPFTEAPIYIGCMVLLAVGLDLAYGRGGQLKNAVAHLMVGLLLISFHLGTNEARDYYRFMGGDARRRGDIETALMAYTKVTEIAPEYSFGHRRLGDLYLRKKQYPEAISAYREAIIQDPEEADFHARLAVALDAAGQGEAAVKSAQKAMTLGPRKGARADSQRIINKYR